MQVLGSIDSTMYFSFLVSKLHHANVGKRLYLDTTSRGLTRKVKTLKFRTFVTVGGRCVFSCNVETYYGAIKTFIDMFLYLPSLSGCYRNHTDSHMNL